MAELVQNPGERDYENMSVIEQGCIDIWIDDIVPCLIDNETGDIKETVVFKIESRSYLEKF